MKVKLFFVGIALAGLASCAQRATCPTYSLEKHPEIKVAQKLQQEAV